MALYLHTSPNTVLHATSSPRRLTVLLPPQAFLVKSFLWKPPPQLQANHHKFCVTMGSKLITNEVVLSPYILIITQLSADLARDQGHLQTPWGQEG